MRNIYEQKLDNDDNETHSAFWGGDSSFFPTSLVWHTEPNKIFYQGIFRLKLLLIYPLTTFARARLCALCLLFSVIISICMYRFVYTYLPVTSYIPIFVWVFLYAKKHISNTNVIPTPLGGFGQIESNAGMKIQWRKEILIRPDTRSLRYCRVFEKGWW